MIYFQRITQNIFQHLENQSDKILTAQQKKVVLVVMVIFAVIAGSLFLYRYCFQTRLHASQVKAAEEKLQPAPEEKMKMIKRQLEISQTLLPPSVSQVMSACPELVIGGHHLFQWDDVKKQITLSSPFRSLLELLIDLETLESAEIHTLGDLNALLQKPQGKGGLLRQPGTERWEITDHPLWQTKRAELEALLAQLGFIHSREINQRPLSVNHCIIFGARAERMESRIQDILQLLVKKDLQAERIFLLGSKRKLVSEERDFLNSKLETFSNEEQRIYWQKQLADDEQATEANAFVLLWEVLVPEALKSEVEGKVVFTQSTRLGFSYEEQKGHRTTTDVTTNDWIAHYQDGHDQSIFAVVEHPYLRLQDHLRTSVLTNAKRATLDLMLQRIAHTTFHFAQKQPQKEPLMGVVLDEIARNVYRTVETLRYLEQIPKN